MKRTAIALLALFPLLDAQASQETHARAMAELYCRQYGYSSEVCASAQRDVQRAIERDRQRDSAPLFPSSPLSPTTPYIPSAPSGYGYGADSVQSSTITFKNFSGEYALVKVRGSTRVDVTVPNGATKTVNVNAGTINIAVRYGLIEPYSYSQGEPMQVEETSTSYSAITLTLHKVANGNYESNRISGAAFDSQ